jgi:hypothetical protein
MAARLYVDVSAVRIQHYLARTTALKGRRGASAAIVEATGLTDESPVLRRHGARINAEAGDADGVVNMLVDLMDRPDLDGPDTDGPDTDWRPDTDDPDTAAETLARRVFAHLRSELPGAEFQAVWGVGESYLEVYHDTIGPRLARGEVLSDLPAAREFPYAVSCRICHHDPATGRVLPGWGEPELDACADCVMRYSRQVRAAGEGHERRLAKALGTSGTPEQLLDLARLGTPGSGRNHIATVFVDGNAFGEFFHQLAGHRERIDAATKSRVSRALNEHTRRALEAATRAVGRNSDGGVLCVVPHLVGGDDVLVSVPADRAWAFTRHYLAEFGRLVEDTVKDTRTRTGVDGLPELSASAGIVFARHSYPFHLIVEQAEACLRRAKARVRGACASVDFTDVTKDGHGGTFPPPLTLADVEAHAGDLDRFAALPSSLRTNLAELLREGPEEERRARVDGLVGRLGRWEAVAPFWDDPKAADPPVISLEQALRIVRWWR